MTRSISPVADTVVKVIISILFSLAFVATALRLYRRKKTGRLWLDDLLAFIATMHGLAVFVLYYMQNAPKGSPLSTWSSQTIRYWMWYFVSKLTIWLARISLALGTARIFPPQHLPHRISLLLATLLSIFMLSETISFTAFCARPSAFKPPPGVGQPKTPKCYQPSSRLWFVSIIHLLGDIFVVAVPLISLWKIKLPARFRQMLFSAFSASVITWMISVVLFVMTLAPERWDPLRSRMMRWASDIQRAVSLIVCNLIVLGSWFFRRIYGPSITGNAATSSITPTRLTRRRTSAMLTIDDSKDANDSSLASNITFTEIESSDHEEIGTGTFGLYDPDTMSSGSSSNNR